MIICSLTMFGVSATLASYSPERAFVSCYQNFGVTDVSLSPYRGTSCGSNCYTRKSSNFSFNSIKAVREETGMPFRVYPMVEGPLRLQRRGCQRRPNLFFHPDRHL